MMRLEVLVLALALAACAAPAAHTYPEEMSAAQHRREAVAHFARAQAAREREVQREHRATVGDRLGSRAPYGYHADVDRWSEEVAGEEHLSAAMTLEREYRFACALIAPEVERRSPFDGHVVAVEPDAEGVVLHLDAAVAPEVLLHQLRCHRAHLAYFGLAQMAECPLGLPGLRISLRRSPTGVDVRLQVADPAELPELVRRARLLQR